MPRIKRETVEIDVAGKSVGRVATRIAMILMGKHKADYVPSMDLGDKVAIKNADKIVFTGKKWDQKTYFRTSNRPGGLKQTLAKDAQEKDPEFVLRNAVKYMLPKNRTQALRMKRLTFVK